MFVYSFFSKMVRKSNSLPPSRLQREVFVITFSHRRERRKRRQEHAARDEELDQEVEEVDTLEDPNKNRDDEKDEKQESSEEKKDCKEECDVQMTTFDNPSPDEIKQLQAQPKKPSEKKME